LRIPGNETLHESRYLARYASELYPALQTTIGQTGIQLYTSMISSLPVKIMSKTGKERDMPFYMEYPGGKTFREITFRSIVNHIVSSLLLDGRAYVVIKRDDAGKVMGLIPVEPYAVKIEVTDEGRMFSILNTGVGQTQWGNYESYANIALGFNLQNLGSTRSFPMDDVLIWDGGVAIPGLGRGVSPLNLAATSVSVAIEVQNYAEEHYASNAARPTVFIFREKLMADDRRNLSDTVADQFRGEKRSNVRALFVNDPATDVKIEQVGDLPRDADVAGVRQYNAQEIAQALRIPLPLAGIAEPGSSSYNSLHVMKSHFASSVIAPMVKLIEEGFKPALKPGTSLVFDLNEITRGDPMSNTQVAERQLNASIATVDEARQKVGLEPIGFDQLLSHKNRGTLDAIIEQEEKQNEETPSDVGKDEKEVEAPSVKGRPTGTNDDDPNDKDIPSK